MEDVLSKIVETKRIEIAATTYDGVVDKAIQTDRKTISMAQSLTTTKGGIIAEFKRHSPSKGWINRDANVVDIVAGYEKAGAAACSVLTDEQYFKGSLEFLKVARTLTQNMPLLRKEFIIDHRQIYESRVAGADAILLIAACISKSQCSEFTEIAHSLGLEVLLEVHNSMELDYITTGVDMVGVNNRNLGSFVTDVNNSFNLIDEIKSYNLNIPYVSESGLGGSKTLKELQKVGFHGFLMGETFMRNDDPAKALSDLITQL